MTVYEATSREFLDDEQLQKDFQRLMRKNSKRLVQRRTAQRERSRMQLEEEKSVHTAAGPPFVNIAKTRDQERRDLQLMIGGVLQYACGNPGEQAKLAWELAANIVATRELVHRDEPPSLSSAELPAEVERGRQRSELQSYLQLTDPTVLNEELGQYQPPAGPLTVSFRQTARSPKQANSDTTRDSIESQADFEIDDDSKQAQAQEQVVQWTAEMEGTCSKTEDTVSNITLVQATLGDVADRARAQAAASQRAVRARAKRTHNAKAQPRAPSGIPRLAPWEPSGPAMAALQSGCRMSCGKELEKIKRPPPPLSEPSESSSSSEVLDSNEWQPKSKYGKGV